MVGPSATPVGAAPMPGIEGRGQPVRVRRRLPAAEREFARKAGAGVVADSGPQRSRDPAAWRRSSAQRTDRLAQPVNAVVPFGTPSPDGPS